MGREVHATLQRTALSNAEQVDWVSNLEMTLKSHFVRAFFTPGEKKKKTLVIACRNRIRKSTSHEYAEIRNQTQQPRRDRDGPVNLFTKEKTVF